MEAELKPHGNQMQAECEPNHVRLNAELAAHENPQTAQEDRN
jgi:hypothetical protein